MRKYFTVLLISSFLIASCEHRMTVEQGKREIELYLKKSYGGRFFIDSISKHYSRDLFKQQVGFKVWLGDKNHTQFGPVFFQKNKYQGGWITYNGTDVLTEYERVIK